MIPLLLLCSISAFGSDNPPDLDKAKALAEQKQGFKALAIVAPCLKAKTRKDFPNLEDCLFLGEAIAERAVGPLGEKYEKETDYGRNGVRFVDWPGVTPYIAMGLNVTYGHYGGGIYRHEFLHKLKSLFPNSKYRDVFEYKFIERGVNDMASVQTWIERLKAYRAEFPSGRYVLQVTFELANAYDDLWEILRPNSSAGYYEYFSSGDREEDTKLAEEYRMTALELYEQIMTYHPIDNERCSYIVKQTKERYAELNAREPSHSFHILSD